VHVPPRPRVSRQATGGFFIRPELALAYDEKPA